MCTRQAYHTHRSHENTTKRYHVHSFWRPGRAMRNDIEPNILLSRAQTKSPSIPLHDNHASLLHVMRIVVT